MKNQKARDEIGNVELMFQELLQEEIQESNFRGEVAGPSNLSGDAKLRGSKVASLNGRRVYEVMIESGFAKIPKQSITTFKPDKNSTETAYVTVIYYDDEEKEHYIAKDVPLSSG